MSDLARPGRHGGRRESGGANLCATGVARGGPSVAKSLPIARRGKFLVAQLQMRELTKANEIRHLQGALAELQKQIERLERQISAAGGLMAPAA
jgi:hypothetical protein